MSRASHLLLGISALSLFGIQVQTAGADPGPGDGTRRHEVICLHPEVLSRAPGLKRWTEELLAQSPKAVLQEQGNTCILEPAVPPAAMARLQRDAPPEKSRSIVERRAPLFEKASLEEARPVLRTVPLPSRSECGPGTAAVSPEIASSLLADVSQAVEELDPESKEKRKRRLHPTTQNVLLLAGGEAVGFGVLLMLPSSVSNWVKTEEDGLKRARRYFKEAWTKPPVWDKDHWAINYVTHPLWGAVYYQMEREAGASPLRSTIFSILASAAWEYGIEATAERPSIQDLIFTPGLGSVWGEVGHRLARRWHEDGFSLAEKIAVTVVNPVYVVRNRGYGKKKD